MLFSVSNETVVEDEFLYAFRKNHTDPSKYTEKSVNEYLQLYINFKLKVRDARARGLDTTRSYRKELRSYRDELKKPYLSSELNLDVLVRETYERLTEEVKASHILIRVQENASPADTLTAYQKIVEIRKELDSGADFGLLARTRSEDPSARVNSGDLGFFTALQMVYAFETAAYQTPTGKVSAPVRTRFGYHLIQVTGRQPASGEVEVSHLMIRVTQSRTEKESRNLIFDLYEQLKGGVDWNEVVAQYSDDPGSKSNGGRLQPFGVGGMSRVPEFERAAFSLQVPGEISDPVATPYGWHIIRLERKIPLPAFSEMEAALRRQVSRNERYQLSREKHFNELSEKYELKSDSSAVARCLSAADSSLLTGNWTAPKAEWLSVPVLTMQGKSYTASDFFSFVRMNQVTGPGDPSERMKAFYQEFKRDCLSAAEEQEIIRRNPDFAYLLAEYEEGLLLFEIMESEVWGRASVDSAGQKTYFEARRQNYRWKERAEARIYSFSTMEERNSARERLLAHDTAYKSSLKPQRGTFERGNNKIVDSTPWRVGVHSVDTHERHYVVEVATLLPSGPKEFKDARASVIYDYQDDIEKRWIVSLKARYKVSVNGKVKKHVISELVKAS